MTLREDLQMIVGMMEKEKEEMLMMLCQMEMNHVCKIAKHLKMMLAQMKIATNGPLKGNA